MRLLLTLLILLPLTASAQSSATRAINEVLNLAPRCARGDAQRMRLTVTHNYLDKDGLINQAKENSITYTQLCITNSANGLEYEIVVDSMYSGGKHAPGAKPSVSGRVKDFEGYSYQKTLTKRMKKRGDCYDHGIHLGENLQYMSAYDFLTMMAKTQMIEQLRFSAGVRLAHLGDTASLALPGPICFQMPEVVKEYRVAQEPIFLRLVGISAFRGRPCALVLFESQPSRMNITFDPTDKSATWIAFGSIRISGEFLVALDDGDIVSMTIRERMCAEMKLPDGTTQPSPALSVFELIQLN